MHPILKLLDAAVPAIVLGEGFTRIGCSLKSDRGRGRVTRSIPVPVKKVAQDASIYK